MTKNKHKKVLRNWGDNFIIDIKNQGWTASLSLAPPLLRWIIEQGGGEVINIAKIKGNARKLFLKKKKVELKYAPSPLHNSSVSEKFAQENELLENLYYIKNWFFFFLRFLPYITTTFH